MSRAFDWPGLVRAGFQQLGLAPVTFWALTPAEMQLLLGQKAGPKPMLKEGLEALMDAYPDRPKDEQ